MVEVVIYGEPVSQSRPRFRRVGKGVSTYDAPKIAKYKKHVAECAKEQYKDEPLKGVLRVDIGVYRGMLKSFTKKQRLDAQNNVLRPYKKPDVDNYAKGVLDGLNEIIWADDGQIIELHVFKRFDEVPRVEVKITELEGENKYEY